MWGKWKFRTTKYDKQHNIKLPERNTVLMSVSLNSRLNTERLCICRTVWKHCADTFRRSPWPSPINLFLSFWISMTLFRATYAPNLNIVQQTFRVLWNMHRRRSSVNFGGKTFLPENMHENLTMPEFYMRFARKINKIPEFYMIYARKN